MNCNEFSEVNRTLDGGSAATTIRPQLTTGEQDMVLESMPKLLKIAHKLVRLWGAPLTRDETESIANLAICDAARRFRQDAGVQFLTYAFHFVRGDLIKSIRAYSTTARHEQSWDESPGNESEESSGCPLEQLPAPEEISSPAQYFERAQMATAIQSGFKALTPLEKTIFLEIHLYGEKVAAVARRLDYSRGHTSELRRTARMKLQGALPMWRSEETLLAA